MRITDCFQVEMYRGAELVRTAVFSFFEQALDACREWEQGASGHDARLYELCEENGQFYRIPCD